MKNTKLPKKGMGGPSPLWNNVHSTPQPKGGFVDNPTGYYNIGGGVGWAILPATQAGAIIDPMGQWAHPGKVTTIPDNNITMKGVPYPVLGISDTGHSQIMKPNKEYTFKGSSVTEYPIMKKNGGKVMWHIEDESLMQNGGTNPPIITHDPNDPRLQAYQDSLTLYNHNDNAWNLYNSTRTNPNQANILTSFENGTREQQNYTSAWDRLETLNNRRPHRVGEYDPRYLPLNGANGTPGQIQAEVFTKMQKPFQPYKYEEPIELNKRTQQLQSNNQTQEPQKVPLPYFTREPQDQERGHTEYFDKKTGKKLAKGGKVTFTKFPLDKFPLEMKAKGGRVNFNIHNGNSEWRIIE